MNFSYQVASIKVCGVLFFWGITQVMWQIELFCCLDVIMQYIPVVTYYREKLLDLVLN